MAEPVNNLIDLLLNENIKGLKPYESARRLFSGAGNKQQAWLNANESPFANEYDIDAQRFNRYPDCQPPAVIDAYAQYAGIESDQLLVSRGADEGIELLIRAFCTPGKDSVLICPPTYGMYAISAETCDVGIERAPLNADFSLDVAAIKAFKGKVNLVFICSPNNPTGTSVDKNQLLEVIEHFADSAIVVIDEAYIEFDRDNSWATQLNQYPNIAILRTLSKAFALAGLRCGFTLAQAPIIQALMKVIAPYPIPEPVAQIAAQALGQNGLATLAQQVGVLNAEKAELKKALMAFNDIALVGDDKANFILFRTPKKSALMAHLVANGILIRDQSKQVNLDNCLRITVGSLEQNKQLLSGISRFFTLQTSTQEA
ncbi:histidinol-phosphate transaminase [Paraglaciecola chathamensis]|uniref:Histidinol-phosphate aminotransferase n=1 Tax=Paraglaciecola chathamensis S18K6 TaxID=1127672 RepID=A0AAV3V2J3_9ALTE|nr:histidinol-phosphate transaminase [Paraglaciecola chathamensis]GAC11152.1 histidinol-phosphate aminotransferase [Paraglaciecola chathamensis S18K6]